MLSVPPLTTSLLTTSLRRLTGLAGWWGRLLLWLGLNGWLLGWLNPPQIDSIYLTGPIHFELLDHLQRHSNQLFDRITQTTVTYTGQLIDLIENHFLLH